MKLIANIIFFILLIFSMPLFPSSAGDFYGTSLKLGDEGTLAGLGFTFKKDRVMRLSADNAWFFIDAFLAGGYEKKDTPAETSRIYFPVSAGIEYRYPVMNLPLSVTGSGAFGAAYFNRMGPVRIGPFIDPSETETINTFGPCLDLLLGLQYQVNMKFAFFINAGYHQVYLFDDALDSLNGGYRLKWGISYAFSGSLKPLMSY